MNEPANMCNFPCKDAEKEARQLGMPPEPPPLRDPPRRIPGYANMTIDSHQNGAFEKGLFSQ